MKVIKRDGRKVEFDGDKITNAIEKAIVSVNKEYLKYLNLIDTSVKAKLFKHNKNIHVEEIQDAVENTLMELSFTDVARSYIRYRNKREDYRNQINNLDKKINELVEMKDNVVKENANKNADVFNTKRDLLAGIVARDYAKRYKLPKSIVSAHEKGEIHWHDMDYSPMFSLYNCMLIDFKEMLGNGFTIGNADIESPKSIKTATALISQIVANVSSNIYGGTTANNIDLILEPYAKKSYKKHYSKHLKRLRKTQGLISNKIENVAKDWAIKDTKKEIYDSMQSLEYEINTLYNSKTNDWSFM